MDNTETRDNLRFAERVGPGSTETLTYEVNDDATIEEVDVRIYRGAELALNIFPYVRLGGDDASKTPLLTLVGKQHIDGDDDTFEFNLAEAVTPGDEIGVDVTNTSTEFGYDFVVDMDLDRAGGTKRAITSLFRGIL